MARDRKFQEKYRNTPCFICEKTDTTVCAHLITVGARPDLATNPNNCMGLCYEHHMEQEKGLTEFVAKYGLEDEMFSRGFHYIEIPDGGFKWIYPDIAH